MSGFVKSFAAREALLSKVALVVLAILFFLSVLPQGAWAEDETDGDASQSVQKPSSVVLDEEENAVDENQLPDTSFIYDSTIEDLASADSYYDKQTVQVVGEATGDILAVDNEPDYCWVMLWAESTTHKGQSNTLTVYMSKTDAELIDTLGAYSRKGTTLQVRGVYNLVCSEHNGISDLHASYVSVTKHGSTVEHPFNGAILAVGVLLLAVGGGLFYLFNRIREKQR